jgi:hypothetical protein
VVFLGWCISEFSPSPLRPASYTVVALCTHFSCRVVHVVPVQLDSTNIHRVDVALSSSAQLEAQAFAVQPATRKEIADVEVTLAPSYSPPHSSTFVCRVLLSLVGGNASVRVGGGRVQVRCFRFRCRHRL